MKNEKPSGYGGIQSAKDQRKETNGQEKRQEEKTI